MGIVAAGHRAPRHCGEPAILATMHAKERVIAPLAERFLGLRVALARGLDTDTFGTFSREIARTGSQLDAARAKIDAAFAAVVGVQIGLASEGSFGPHPHVPFCALDREIVILVDRKAGLELVGYHATTATNFSHSVVANVAAGLEFAIRSGFPEHGMFVMGCHDGLPAPDLALIKDAATWDELALELRRVIGITGSAHIETDMRAHRNPQRMRAIKRATIDLVRRASSACPGCGRPGYGVTGRVPGLPCLWCGAPTALTLANVLSCSGCGWSVEQAVPATTASPAHCGACNP